MIETISIVVNGKKKKSFKLNHLFPVLYHIHVLWVAVIFLSETGWRLEPGLILHYVLGPHVPAVVSLVTPL